VRALRNFSSSLKSAEASRAAERDRSERQAHSVSKQAPPPRPLLLLSRRSSRNQAVDTIVPLTRRRASGCQQRQRLPRARRADPNVNKENLRKPWGQILSGTAEESCGPTSKGALT